MTPLNNVLGTPGLRQWHQTGLLQCTYFMLVIVHCGDGKERMSQGAVQMEHTKVSNPRALLSAETGEVEAGAEGIHEITLVVASLWDATQKRLRVTQAILAWLSAVLSLQLPTASPRQKGCTGRGFPWAQEYWEIPKTPLSPLAFDGPSLDSAKTSTDQ